MEDYKRALLVSLDLATKYRKAAWIFLDSEERFLRSFLSFFSPPLPTPRSPLVFLFLVTNSPREHDTSTKGWYCIPAAVTILVFESDAEKPSVFL